MPIAGPKTAALLLIAAVCAASVAQEATAAKQPMQGVLDRIRAHAANEKWRQGDFADPAIETWLDQVVGIISQATSRRELVLPVRLSGVQPVNSASLQAKGSQRYLAPAIPKSLLVGRNIDFPHANLTDSIVLADGRVNLRRAEGCVVVARGPVSIGKTAYSVVASGVYVEIWDSDGIRGDRNNGSVVVCRGPVDVDRAYSSVIAARQGAYANTAARQTVPRLAESENVRRFNFDAPTQIRGPNGLGGRALPDLPLEASSALPLAAAIQFQGITRADASKVSPSGASSLRRIVDDSGGSTSGYLGIVVRHAGRRYVARPDQPILDETGQPVAALHGWTVSLINDKAAVFSSDTGDFLVPLTNPREGAP